MFKKISFFFNFQEITIYFNVSIFLIKLFKISIQIWLLPNTDTSICTPIAILGIKTMQKQFLLHHLLWGNTVYNSHAYPFQNY